MRARLSSLLLALPLAGAVTSAFPADTTLPSEPKKRLEALQHALVGAAMEGQTRVRNAAWVDSTGKLHENTRITSDMKVRNVRVLNYLTVEDGVSAAIVAESRGVTPDAEVCKANQQRYRREATLDATVRIAASGAERTHWQAFADQARARFAAQSHSAGKWLLVASQPPAQSMYDAHLTGFVPDVAPYQIMIELLPAGALGIEPVRPKAEGGEQLRQSLKTAKDYLLDEPKRSEPVPFVLRLSVVERMNRRLLWQDAVPLFFPEREITTTSRPLPVGLLTELDQVVARWQQRLDADFGCRPQSFNVVQSSPNGWVINGGQAAGLAVGDQLLLMNREQVPARILEPDSGEYLALVEVTSVAQGRAVVRKLAGAAQVARSGDWVATPF